MSKVKKSTQLLSAILLLLTASLMAQNPQPLRMNVGADIVSRYVWRGYDFGGSPSIQPTFSLSKGAFEAGFWGAYATNSDFTETDFYLKANVKSFSFILTDYFVPNSLSDINDSRYFAWSNKNEIRFDPITGNPEDKFTTHLIEAAVQFNGTEKFPVRLLVGTMLFGNDKLPTDTITSSTGAIEQVNFENQYSTYIELGYSFSIQENNIDLFLGFTPTASVYSTPLYEGDFAMVNAGITGYRALKITDEFELPLKASLIFNPQASTIFFVFGITL